MQSWLKRTCTKNYVSASAGVENTDANANQIIFTIQDTKLCVPVGTLLAKNNLKLSKLLSKGFKRSICWNEYKTNSENKNIANKYKYFIESTFVGVNRLFVTIHLNRDNDVKQFKAQSIIYQKVLSRVTIDIKPLSMEKLLWRTDWF